MHKFSVAFIALAALQVIQATSPTESSEPKTAKYFIKNMKGLDYKVIGKKDDHRFGVEVKENKQFHHTKTAEDGVRLGCYGHEQEGKQYSTHYVADGKGYRLVNPVTTITVYPKDGTEPRKASFAKSFNDETIKNGNVRYIFPDGCEAPLIEIEIPKIEKKEEVIRPPPPAPTTTTTTTTTPEPEPETTKMLEPELDTTTMPEPVPETTTESVVEEILEEDVCANKCCNEDRAQIVFPANNSEGCCQNISKIVVPIDTDMLSRCSIEEIVEITNETDKVKMLKKLLKFTIKYKF